MCTLDKEILTLVGDDDIEMEIEQGDQFKEWIHLAIFQVQHKISDKQTASFTAPQTTDSSHTISTTTSSSPDTNSSQ